MIRGFLGNHEGEQEYINEFIKFYNKYTGAIKKTLDIRPFIHILDCTKIVVNLNALRTSTIKCIFLLCML